MKKEHSKNTFTAVLGIAVVLLGLSTWTFFQLNQTSQDQLQEAKQNLIAVQDSIKTYQSQLGVLTSERAVYKGSQEQLKELNDSLYRELDLANESVRTVTLIETIIRPDTVYIESRVSSDTVKSIIDFEFEEQFIDSYHYFAGYTTFRIDSATYDVYDAITVITDEVWNLHFKTGLMQEDDVWKVFIETDVPYFNVTRLDGAVIDLPKSLKQNTRRWNVGLQVGYGTTLHGWSPYAGAGITFDIFP